MSAPLRAALLRLLRRARAEQRRWDETPGYNTGRHLGAVQSESAIQHELQKLDKPKKRGTKKAAPKK